MQIVKYKQEDHYDIMMALWRKRKWQPCAADMLPKIGLVLFHENRFIAYMGIYIESGTMGFIGWALTDPDTDTNLNDKALKELFHLLLDIGKNKNCKLIYSITDEKEWGKRLENYGMVVAEEGVSVYAMFLKEK
jgi:uncharacterized protein YpbB